MAQESSLAVIIRQKPSKRMCTILWDRSNDTFTMGDCVTQIVPKYCDLSPDGKHLFYYAGIRGNHWVAICKAPVLRDMVVKLAATTHGGMFINNHTFQVHGYAKSRYYDDTVIESNIFNLKSSSIEGIGDKYDKAYMARLVRDGWEVDDIEYGEDYYRKTVLKKKVFSDWYLGKTILGKKEIYLLYKKDKNSKVIECLGWDWAEYANSELLFTKEGCLYRSKTIANIENAELIKDLNNINTNFNKQPFTLNGSQALQGGKYYDDVEALKRAIDEGHDEAYFHLARSRKYKEKKSIKEIDKLYVTGMSKLEKKGLLAYWNFDIYGRFLFIHKKFKEALTLYKQALDVVQNDEQKATIYIYLTVLYSYYHEKKLSLDCKLKSKILFSKTRKDYAYQLANKYKETEQYELAYTYYLLEIEENQEYIAREHVRYNIYDELDEVCCELDKSMLSVYLSLYKSHPNDKFVLQRLSLAYLEIDNIEKAYLLLDELIATYDDMYHKNKIHMSFAKALFQYEKYDLAVEMFEELLTSEFSSWRKAECKNYIGVIYNKKKEYKTAKEYFSEAIKLDTYEQLYKDNYELVVKVISDES